MLKSLSIILIQRHILHFSQKQICFRTYTFERNKYLIFTQILDVFMYICMKALRYPKRPFFIFKILFIYFDYTTSSLLSPVAASRCYSSLQRSGFSLLQLLALQSTGFRRTGSSACSVVARGLVSTGSEVVAQGRSCFVV